MRALGNLSRFVQFSNQSGVSLSRIISGAEKLPARSDLGIRQKGQSVLGSFQGTFLDDSRWLGRMVQAFLSCVATGNVKVFFVLLIKEVGNHTFILSSFNYHPS